MECFKCCLMGHISRLMKDNGADNDLKCQELAQEVLEKNFSMLLTIHSCDILAKEVVAFCPCPKSLPEAKVKSFPLILLAEEFSKKSI